MTQCSLQLCLGLFCNQTWRFIYRSDEALYVECSHIKENKTVNIYKHDTAQDCPVGNTDTILQYYEYVYILIFSTGLRMASTIYFSALTFTKKHTLYNDWNLCITVDKILLLLLTYILYYKVNIRIPFSHCIYTIWYLEQYNTYQTYVD